MFSVRFGVFFASHSLAYRVIQSISKHFHVIYNYTRHTTLIISHCNFRFDDESFVSDVVKIFFLLNIVILCENCEVDAMVLFTDKRSEVSFASIHLIESETKWADRLEWRATFMPDDKDDVVKLPSDLSFVATRKFTHSVTSYTIHQWKIHAKNAKV